ncbi:MAG: histidine phosphatase family protein [Lentisphaeria bacterium]
MCFLILVRHGTAGRGDGCRDFDRPLTSEGANEILPIATALEKHGCSPDLIIASSALRARQTADRLAGFTSATASVFYEDSLYLASAGKILQRIRNCERAAGRLMLVGHNPGLAQLVDYLSAPDVTADNFPPSACAVFKLKNKLWPRLSPDTAELDLYLSPMQSDAHLK